MARQGGAMTAETGGGVTKAARLTVAMGRPRQNSLFIDLRRN